SSPCATKVRRSAVAGGASATPTPGGDACGPTLRRWGCWVWPSPNRPDRRPLPVTSPRTVAGARTPSAGQGVAMSEWFESARFGLFVHWGAYSARGWEPSWPMVGGTPSFPYGQDLPVDEYRSCFA